MDSLIFSINTILPILLLITIGMLTKKLGLITQSVTLSMNKLVFQIFLPAMLFKNLLTADKSISFSLGIFLYIGISISLLFGILFLLVPRFVKERQRKGVLIQGIARCNYAIFGIPLVTMLFPDRDISLISLLTILVVPLVNTLSAIALEINTSETINWKKAVKSILLNPLVLSSSLGFLLMELNVTLPTPLLKTVTSLASIASPLALFLLGASLEFSKLSADKPALFTATFLKLIFFPAIFIIVGVLLGFRGVELSAILITFAAPTSVSSFPMAVQMGGDIDLAGGIVVFTSVFSMLTVFLFIYVLNSLGYLM